MQSVDEILKSIGPFTRVYCLGALGLTFLANVGVVPASMLTFSWARIARGEIWRILTPFFLYGAFSPTLFMSIFSLGYSLAALEKELGTGAHKRERMFSFMIMFAFILTVVSGIVYPSPSFAAAFEMFVKYVWGRKFPNASASLYGLVNIKPIWLPYITLAMSACANDGGMKLRNGIRGLVIGHAYFYMTEMFPLINGGRDPIGKLNRLWRRLIDKVAGSKEGKKVFNAWQHKSSVNTFSSLTAPNAKGYTADRWQGAFKGKARHIAEVSEDTENTD